MRASWIGAWVFVFLGGLGLSFSIYVLSSMLVSFLSGTPSPDVCSGNMTAGFATGMLFLFWIFTSFALFLFDTGVQFLRGKRPHFKPLLIVIGLFGLPVLYFFGCRIL